LPKLLGKIPENSGFVNGKYLIRLGNIFTCFIFLHDCLDLPAARLIKLLSKHFQDSWQYLLRNKVSAKFLLKTQLIYKAKF